MFLATERACGSKKHTARITMISLGGCPGHLRGWNGTTRRTEALTDTSRRQGTGRHPIPGCRSNCARRPDGLDGERARPRGHAAAEQRLTRPGPGGNPVCSSRAKVLVSTAYLRARPQKVARKTRTHLARVCAPSTTLIRWNTPSQQHRASLHIYSCSALRKAATRKGIDARNTAHSQLQTWPAFFASSPRSPLCP